MDRVDEVDRVDRVDEVDRVGTDKPTVRLTIDDKPVEVSEGTTILAAARTVGIEIPTLCFMEGLPAQTSCFVCVVQVEGNDNFLPACSTPAAEGMVVRTRSQEVLETRRTALELLLSDHAGCCVASCSMGCPADLDIPRFVDKIVKGDNRAAVEVIKRTLPLPAVLGSVCPAYCESACMRKRIDESLSVRALHRAAAERDLETEAPYCPECKPPSGRRVAIVGAGPAGLSAAYYLLQEGHDCALFDAEPRAGGLLRKHPASKLDQTLVDREIVLIERLGARFQFNWRLGTDGSLAELHKHYDAVLLAFGAWVNPESEKRTVDFELARAQGIEVARRGVAIDRETQAMRERGVFAAGEAVTGPSQMIWAVAAGRNAACSISQFLRGEIVKGEKKLIYFWRKQQSEQEMQRLYGQVKTQPCAIGQDKPEETTTDPAAAVHGEAIRCLQCGCPQADSCKLRVYATQYGAQFNRYRGERRELDPDLSHPELVYEPGKCILCGLCVRIAQEAGEAAGLCFIGRGFAARMAAPLGLSLAEGLKKSARACAEVCPSGALSLRKT